MAQMRINLNPVQAGELYMKCSNLIDEVKALKIELTKSNDSVFNCKTALKGVVCHFKELNDEHDGLRPSELFVLTDVKTALAV